MKRKNICRVRLLGKLLLILFLVSNDSVHRRLLLSFRIFIALLSDPDLWSVAEQILP